MEAGSTSRFDMTAHEPRIGIDLGGTKIEGIVMQADSSISQRLRIPTPHDDYAGQVHAIADLVTRLERECGRGGLRVGVGHPGAISPRTGVIKNANSVCLNGRPLKRDLEQALGRTVRMANDADCLAASEQSDGAAAGASSVFAVILGTGVGGGIAIDGRLLSGPNAIAGEWGHNPLPWPRPDWNEIPGPLHWDGRQGPIEAWLSGPGLAADHERVTGTALTGEAVVDGASHGDPACRATLERYEDRLARALATVINLIDPQVIVLGGGLSRIERLYRNVPRLWSSWVFSDRVDTRLVPALHGDSSGVRGAARLWPDTGSRTAHAS